MNGQTCKTAIAKAMNGIAKYIGGLTKYDIELDVVFNNTVTASTSYLRDDLNASITGCVSLPVLDDDTVVEKSFYEKLIAYTAHEILHPLLTNFVVFQQAGKNGYGDLLNCAEDAFIEAHSHRKVWQAGAVPMLGRAMARLMDESVEGGWHPGDPDSAAWTLKCLGYVDVVKYPELQRFRPFIMKGLAANPDLRRRIGLVLDEVERELAHYGEDAVLKHSIRTKELLMVIEAAFPKGAATPPPPPPPPPEGEEGDPEGDPGDNTKGDDTGDSTKGDDTKGDDAEGGDTGDNTEGDAEGDEPGDTKGDDAEGDDAEGDDAEGDDAEGDAEGNTHLPRNPKPQSPKDLFDDIEEEAHEVDLKGQKALDETYGGVSPDLLRRMFSGASVWK